MLAKPRINWIKFTDLIVFWHSFNSLSKILCLTYLSNLLNTNNDTLIPLVEWGMEHSSQCIVSGFFRPTNNLGVLNNALHCGYIERLLYFDSALHYVTQYTLFICTYDS